MSLSLHNLVSLINRHPSNVTYLERDKNFNFVGFFCCCCCLITFSIDSWGVLRIIGSCVCVQESAWPTSDGSRHQEWNRQPKVTLFSYPPCCLPPKAHNTTTHEIKFNETELRKTPWLSLTTLPYLNLPKVYNVASLALVHLQIQFPYRYINSRIMAVTMDPKPEKLRENVILKFKNLKVIWKLAVMRCFDLFSPIKFIFRSWQQISTVCFGVA